jgi:recombination protein RecT
MAYCIPYKNNKDNTTVAQFQLGYKGFKQLALRSGQFSVIPNATDIKEGELKSRNRLTGECVFEFIEDDTERSKAKTIGYASYFKLLNGAESTFYMSIEEMEAHALRYSQTYRSKTEYIRKSSKWTTDFDDMAKKTVIKLNLSRNAPLSVEMQDAIKADQSVMYEADKYEYADNMEQQMIDAQKAQEVADKFADFDDVTDKKEGK